MSVEDYIHAIASELVAGGAPRPPMTTEQALAHVAAHGSPDARETAQRALESLQARSEDDE